MKPKLAEPLPSRVIVRLVIDEHMVALHAWLGTIPSGVRSREVCALVRLGFAVQSGQASLIASGSQILPNTHQQQTDNMEVVVASGVHDELHEADDARQALISLGYDDLSIFSPPSNIGMQ